MPDKYNPLERAKDYLDFGIWSNEGDGLPIQVQVDRLHTALDFIVEYLEAVNKHLLRVEITKD